jgi:alpha-L-arabinofuranosidase
MSSRGVGFILPLLATLGVTGPVAPQPQSATIAIDAVTVEGRISPLLYGQFLEFMFGGIKGGLHAELVRDRSFEEAPNAIGLPRDWQRYPDDRNDDYGITFASDDQVAYPDASHGDAALIPRRSLRVELKPAVIERHGLFQARVPVRRGIVYEGYVWIKTGDYKGEVRVALEADASGGRVYDEARIAGVSGNWKRYAFRLTSPATDPLARLVILFDGPGTLWIDQVSLLPGDAINGVRADVHREVKALAPAFLRWPGGNVAQDYHWRWGTGPPDERPAWINLSWKNEPEPSDFGTAEFIAFARSVGAEPSLTVNVEGRGATVEEAAAWVEYCNGPPDSKYGALRARHGHPAPYGVKYWEIGNEIWGDWVRGHSDAATYARNLTRYSTAMRAVDPSITIIAVGDNDLDWDRTVLRSEAPIDYLAVHHYYGRKEMNRDPNNLMARPLHYDRWYGEFANVSKNLRKDRTPMLAVNEWGLDLPESGQHSILAALYGARLMNVFERRSDVVGMSAVSDLVNGWPGGIIQAARDRVFTTPVYLVNKLYATHLGVERLATKVDGPMIATSREGDAVPVLDAVASRSGDGRKIYVKAVNTDLSRALSATVTIRGAQVASTGTVDRVVAESIAASNSFRTPDAVQLTHAAVATGRRFVVALPAHSVAVITIPTTD